MLRLYLIFSLFSSSRVFIIFSECEGFTSWTVIIASFSLSLQASITLVIHRHTATARTLYIDLRTKARRFSRYFFSGRALLVELPVRALCIYRLLGNIPYFDYSSPRLMTTSFPLMPRPP